MTGIVIYLGVMLCAIIVFIIVGNRMLGPLEPLE